MAPLFATGGDSVSAAFAWADAAVAAAIEMQARLVSAPWPDGLVPKVRMGLHTGESDERSDDYFGPAVNRAARVMQAANGSQILVSSATRDDRHVVKTARAVADPDASNQ
jgi:class 3 adenylate cyclase